MVFLRPRLSKQNAANWPPPSLLALRGECHREQREKDDGIPMMWYRQMCGKRWNGDSQSFRVAVDRWRRLARSAEQNSEELEKHQARYLKRKVCEGIPVADKRERVLDMELEEASEAHYAQHRFGEKEGKELRELLRACNLTAKAPYDSADKTFDPFLGEHMCPFRHACCLSPSPFDIRGRQTRTSEAHQIHTNSLKELKRAFDVATRNSAESICNALWRYSKTKLNISSETIDAILLKPCPGLSEKFSFDFQRTTCCLSEHSARLDEQFHTAIRAATHFFDTSSHQCPNEWCCRSDNRYSHERRLEFEKLQIWNREVCSLAIQKRRAEIFGSSRPVLEKHVFLSAIHGAGWERTLRHISYDIKVDKAVALEALATLTRAANDGTLVAPRHLWAAFEHAFGAFCQDREFLIDALKGKWWAALKLASDDLRGEKAIVLQVLAQNGAALKWASTELQADKEVALVAVRTHVSALKYATYAVRNDRTVVLEATRNDYRSFQFATEICRGDADLVLEALYNDYRVFSFATYAVRSDKDVVLAAIQVDFRAFQFATGNLRREQEFVLEAMEYDHRIFELSACRGNKPVAIQAVERDYGMLRYVSSELKADSEVVLTAVRQDSRALLLSNTDKILKSASFNADTDAQNSIIAQDKTFLVDVLVEYDNCGFKITDKAVALTAVGKCGRMLKYVSDELRADKDVVLAAILPDGSWKHARTLEYASTNLKADREVILAAVSHEGLALQHASSDLQDDKDIVLLALKNNKCKAADTQYRLLMYASSRLQNNKEVVLVAVGFEGEALKFASPALQNDREVVIAAVYKSTRALAYASDNMKVDREVFHVMLTKCGDSGWM
jgi:hypothetical protein